MAQHYGYAWDKHWRVRYRLLLLWYSYSSSDFFFMSLANQKKELGALKMKDIYNGKAWILTLGLFKPTDKDGVYERDYLPDEDRLGYFHRALTKVDTKFALVWKLDRLLANRGCAEHSNLQFADELGRNVSWISRYLKEIVAEGIFNRYGGNKGGRGGSQPIYYCNPGDEHLNQELLERYGEHIEEVEDHTDDKFDDPVFQAQRQQRILDRERAIERRFEGLLPKKDAPVIRVYRRPKKPLTPVKINRDFEP